MAILETIFDRVEPGTGGELSTLTEPRPKTFEYSEQFVRACKQMFPGEKMMELDLESANIGIGRLLQHMSWGIQPVPEGTLMQFGMNQVNAREHIAGLLELWNREFERYCTEYDIVL